MCIVVLPWCLTSQDGVGEYDLAEGRSNGFHPSIGSDGQYIDGCWGRRQNADRTIRDVERAQLGLSVFSHVKKIAVEG